MLSSPDTAFNSSRPYRQKDQIHLSLVSLKGSKPKTRLYQLLQKLSIEGETLFTPTGRTKVYHGFFIYLKNHCSIAFFTDILVYHIFSYSRILLLCSRVFSCTAELSGVELLLSPNSVALQLTWSSENLCLIVLSMFSLFLLTPEKTHSLHSLHLIVTAYSPWTLSSILKSINYSPLDLSLKCSGGCISSSFSIPYLHSKIPAKKFKCQCSVIEINVSPNAPMICHSSIKTNLIKDYDRPG